MVRLLPAILGLLPILGASAAPTAALNDRAIGTATVVIPSPDATVLGNVMNDVESFGGIPYAHPPVGPLRMKPPQRLTEPMGTFDGTGPAGACPQMFSSNDANHFLLDTLGDISEIPFVQNVTGQSEDCLSITVARPEGTEPEANLPVLYWIFGGAFQLGWSSMYDGTGLVNYGVEIGKPFIFVAIQFRVGGYGFMPGKELMDEGSGNAGLLDQRMGLEWVADNIAAFGGDPDRVTIWGESAGAISVCLQMAMFDGDITYKDKPLFRAGIMSSGSVVPVKPMDTPKGQAIYDKVVETGGCSDAEDTLNCLRELSYDDFLEAANSVPAFLSFSSLALSYLPRPDGVVLTDSPDALIRDGKYAAVPFIIGDQEDEGTLMALFQSELNTKDKLVGYLKGYYFEDATEEELGTMVDTYGSGMKAVVEGSPHRTGVLNEIFPGFKQRAAILGDMTFTLTRRLFLSAANQVNEKVPSWSYLMSQNQGTPILGTFHGGDIFQTFFGVFDNYAAKSVRAYFINFMYTLDPNGDGDDEVKFPEWPKWADEKKMVQVFRDKSELLDDDFREDSYNWLEEHIDIMRF